MSKPRKTGAPDWNEDEVVIGRLLLRGVEIERSPDGGWIAAGSNLHVSNAAVISLLESGVIAEAGRRLRITQAGERNIAIYFQTNIEMARELREHIFETWPEFSNESRTDKTSQDSTRVGDKNSGKTSS